MSADECADGPSTTTYRQPAPVLIAACWLSAAGVLLFNVMPAFLASAGTRYALSDEQIGWVGSSYGTGLALVSVTSFFWIVRFNWRRLAALGAAISTFSMAACALAANPMVLLGGVLAAGLGCGLQYTVGIAVVAENHDPDRAFGIKLAAETSAGVAMLIALPSLVATRWGFQGVAITIACVMALCGLMAMRSTPARREAGLATSHGTGVQPQPDAPGHPWFSWLGLGALCVSFAGMVAVWAFLERIAPTFGLSAGQTERAVVGIVIANALSGVAAGLIGDRWGRTLPLTVAMLLGIVGVVFLAVQHDTFGFMSGALLTYGMLNMPLSYQMGLIASSDKTGRIAVLIPAALSLGSAIGPALVGSLLTGNSYTPLYAFAAGTIAASLTAFLLLAHQLVRRRTVGLRK